MPLLPDRVTTATVLGVAAGTAVMAGVGLAVARHLRRAEAEHLPDDSQWRRVGRLSHLALFPLKSGMPIASDELEVTPLGIRRGPIRDRVFAGFDRNGTFITGRSHPRLTRIQVDVVPRKGGAGEDDVLFKFTSPHVPDSFTFDPASVKAAPLKRVKLWKSSISMTDCGDEAAAWLRKAIEEPSAKEGDASNVDIRLAYYPLQHSDRQFIPQRLPEDRGAFADEGTFHLMTTSSVAAVNEHLANPVPVAQFRPNFTIEGTKAFEEDTWQWVRIGEAIFHVTQPCGRCMMTTIDPTTGIKSPNHEPLMTLRKHRKPTAEQKKKIGSDAPVLGNILGFRRRGKVRVGDDVFVIP